MQVVDQFFHSSNERGSTEQRVYAKAARNICARCVANPECLEDALDGPRVGRGIRAGLSVNEINLGRSWRAYEQGLTDTPPKTGPRPSWLAMTDATHLVEAMRLRDDTDEEVVEP